MCGLGLTVCACVCLCLLGEIRFEKPYSGWWDCWDFQVSLFSLVSLLPLWLLGSSLKFEMCFSSCWASSSSSNMWNAHLVTNAVTKNWVIGLSLGKEKITKWRVAYCKIEKKQDFMLWDDLSLTLFFLPTTKSHVRVVIFNQSGTHFQPLVLNSLYLINVIRILVCKSAIVHSSLECIFLKYYFQFSANKDCFTS